MNGQDETSKQLIEKQTDKVAISQVKLGSSGRYVHKLYDMVIYSAQDTFLKGIQM
jgi:hypothetical protein